jgi:two-component system chemotaxis sensor kinase CheA
MDDILKEFLVESYENLDRLDRDLVVLEKDPHSTETLGSIFRTIHTLKGTSGFLGFGKLEAVAHVGENLLSKMRDGVITINPDIASALLATVDAVRLMLGEIEKTGQPGQFLPLRVRRRLKPKCPQAHPLRRPPQFQTPSQHLLRHPPP